MTEARTVQCLIDGRLQAGDRRHADDLNPATGRSNARVVLADMSIVAPAIATARRAPTSPSPRHAVRAWARWRFDAWHGCGSGAAGLSTRPKATTHGWPSVGVREGVVFGIPSNHCAAESTQ